MLYNPLATRARTCEAGQSDDNSQLLLQGQTFVQEPADISREAHPPEFFKPQSLERLCIHRTSGFKDGAQHRCDFVRGEFIEFSGTARAENHLRALWMPQH